MLGWGSALVDKFLFRAARYAWVFRDVIEGTVDWKRDVLFEAIGLYVDDVTSGVRSCACNGSLLAVWEILDNGVAACVVFKIRIWSTKASWSTWILLWNVSFWVFSAWFSSERDLISRRLWTITFLRALHDRACSRYFAKRLDFSSISNSSPNESDCFVLVSFISAFRNNFSRVARTWDDNDWKDAEHTASSEWLGRLHS